MGRFRPGRKVPERHDKLSDLHCSPRTSSTWDLERRKFLDLERHNHLGSPETCTSNNNLKGAVNEAEHH